MWYKWSAYNSQALYGWTQDVALADAITEHLNRDRGVNMYACDTLSDAEAEALRLDDNNELVCDDDTTIEGYLGAIDA